jgi:hypothetical protein
VGGSDSEIVDLRGFAVENSGPKPKHCRQTFSAEGAQIGCFLVIFTKSTIPVDQIRSKSLSSDFFRFTISHKSTKLFTLEMLDLVCV